MSLNFLPRMDPTKLVEGYRSVLKQIYSSDAYYKRVKLYLKRTEAAPGEKRIKQRWMTRANARALVTSIIRQGVFGRQRWSYWKFLATAATRYRHSFGAAMTLVVMGYHFQVMTRRLSKFKLPAFPTTVNEKDLPAETGGQVQSCTFNIDAVKNLKPGLCRSVVGSACTYAAHLKVCHLDRQRAFDLAQIVALRRSGKGRSNSLRRRAAGAANAMHKILCHFRHIEVDHVGNVGNVEATGSYIGGNQHTVPAIGEVAQSLVALRLRTVAVNLDCRMAGAD
jgi:hypothetical protein